MKRRQEEPKKKERELGEETIIRSDIRCDKERTV